MCAAAHGVTGGLREIDLYLWFRCKADVRIDAKLRLAQKECVHMQALETEIGTAFWSLGD